MKTSLTSLDIMCLVEELRPNIVNSWLNNIYSIGEKLLILKFRKSSKSNFELVIELGKRFHKTEFVRDKPPFPSNKVSMMRKHIRDLPVENFYQVGLDRVIIFEIAYKDTHYKLVIELFGQGNYILVSPENKILVAKNYRKMRDRDIHPGKEFKLPPNPDMDITKLTEEKIREKLSESSDKIGYVLNKLMGLGPKYSKNVLLKADIKDKKVKELETDEINKIIEEIIELKKIIIKKEFDPRKYYDEEELIQITPIPLKRYEDLRNEKAESYNQAIDKYFTANEEEPEYLEDKKEVSGTLSKYEKILSDQIKHKERLEQQEKEEKLKADLLYANFGVAEELLDTIMEAKKANISWEEIKEKLEIGKEKNIQAATILERIEPKNKRLWVTLSNLDSKQERTIELDFTKSVAENANKFYEKSKKAKKKLPGTLKAIEKTKALIKETEEKGEIIEEKEEQKKMVQKRTRKWYEKFHWFKCNDFTIIGGTDARTNERLLRTYLEDDDLFFHADVHGAPYVIVKNGLNNLSEECKKQTSNFALSYSSLWKDKKLVGDVYCVSPDQVSLSAPSGQYLPKGGVMIYGTKEYFRNVETDHSLGLLIFKNYAQIIGGPTEAIREKSEYIIRIKPGDIPKGSMAKKLKQEFMKMCPEEEKYKVEAININEIMKFIPGNSDFR